MQWRWSSSNLLNDTHAAGLLDTTINPPPNNNDNLRNNIITNPGACHPSIITPSSEHRSAFLNSLEALAKVRAQFQAKLPASSGKARPPGIHYLGPHPCSTYRRAWIIQRTYLLTSLCHSPAAFCYSVLYSIHCDIVTRPVVHQI